MKGEGTPQINAKKQTDDKILNCIRKNPGIGVRRLISKSGVKSPNSVTYSVRRLYQNKRILKIHESKLFPKIKIRKNTVGYVCHFPELEKKQVKKLEKFISKKDDILRELKKLQDKEFNYCKPHVNELALLEKAMIKQKYEPTLFKFRNKLNVIKVNPSMIGFFIFKEIEKNNLKHNDFPLDPTFYFKMMPKNLCSIKFENEEDFKNFCIKHHKDDPLKFIHVDSIKKFPVAFNFVITNFYHLVKNENYDSKF